MGFLTTAASVMGGLGQLAGGVSGLFGGGGSSGKSDRALQLNLATNAIKYRVADAKRAGINPLAALGVTPMNYSPSFVGSKKDPSKYLNQMGQGLSSLGRLGDKTAQESIELDNEGKRLEILEKKMLLGLTPRPVGAPPPVDGTYNQTLSGQTQSGSSLSNFTKKVLVQPKQTTVQGGPGHEAGSIAMFQFVNRPDGGLDAVISKDLSEPAESHLKTKIKTFVNDFRNWRDGHIYLARPNRKGSARYFKMQEMVKDSITDKPAPGKTWKYNVNEDAWYQRPIGGDNLFDPPRGSHKSPQGKVWDWIKKKGRRWQRYNNKLIEEWRKNRR